MAVFVGIRAELVYFSFQVSIIIIVTCLCILVSIRTVSSSVKYYNKDVNSFMMGMTGLYLLEWLGCDSHVQGE